MAEDRTERQLAEQYVTNLYWFVFERTPDAVGFDFWVGKIMNERAGKTELLIAFLGSDELRDRMAGQGIGKDLALGSKV